MLDFCCTVYISKQGSININWIYCTSLIILRPRLKCACPCLFNQPLLVSWLWMGWRYNSASPLCLHRRVMEWPLPLLKCHKNGYSDITIYFSNVQEHPCTLIHYRFQYGHTIIRQARYIPLLHLFTPKIMPAKNTN